MTTSEEETQLRRALSLIGDELASPDPDRASEPEGAGEGRPPWWKRHRTPLVLAAAASVVAAAVLGNVIGRGEDAPSQDASQSLNDAEWIACSPGIGLGRITEVSDSAEPDQVRLTMSVSEWLKAPQPESSTVTFEAMSGAFTDDPPFEPGQTVLVVLHQPRNERAEVFRADNPKRSQDAEQVRRLVERNLDEASRTACPGPGAGSRDDT